MTEQGYISGCIECPDCDGGRMLVQAGMCGRCKATGGIPKVVKQ